MSNRNRKKESLLVELDKLAARKPVVPNGVLTWPVVVLVVACLLGVTAMAVLKLVPSDVATGSYSAVLGALIMHSMGERSRRNEKEDEQ